MLMNVALHGMEEAAGVRYVPTGANAGTARPNHCSDAWRLVAAQRRARWEAAARHPLTDPERPTGRMGADGMISTA